MTSIWLCFSVLSWQIRLPLLSSYLLFQLVWRSESSAERLRCVQLCALHVCATVFPIAKSLWVKYYLVMSCSCHAHSQDSRFASLAPTYFRYNVYYLDSGLEKLTFTEILPRRSSMQFHTNCGKTLFLPTTLVFFTKEVFTKLFHL